MSSATEELGTQGDAQVALLLLRKKLISDGQLKAAIDYQRSLGGRIPDILVKLGLVRPAQLETCLQQGAAEEAGATETARPLQDALEPKTVKVSDLKVHRRLLDKIPRELVEERLLVPFFPLPSGNSRKIILGHGREVSAELVDKVHAILGVELCTLKLAVDVAQSIGGSRGNEGTKVSLEPPVKPVPAEGETLLAAVISLLVKKGVLTREELDAECRRRST